MARYRGALSLLLLRQFTFQIRLQDHNIDLNTLDPQIKNAMVELNELHSALSRLGSTSDGVGMFMEFGKTISGVINH